MLIPHAKIVDIKPECSYEKRDGSHGRKIVFYVEASKPKGIPFIDLLALELCNDKIDQYDIKKGEVYSITLDCFATEFHVTDYHNRLIVHTMKYIDTEED